MRLVDTSAWIEYLVGSPTGLKLALQFPEPSAWLVPTMVQLELAKWLARHGDDDGADRVIAFTETCIVAPLDTAIAIAAAELCRRHGLATADAVILATAEAYHAELLTCDRHFEGVAGVIFQPKSSP